MSFWQWNDDPAHVIALIGLGASGFYTGRWLTKPPRPAPPAIASPQPHPQAFGGNLVRVRRPDPREARITELESEVGQVIRIIEHLVTEIDHTRDDAVKRSLRERVTEATERLRILTNELESHRQ